jgi:hypothetical protein
LTLPAFGPGKNTLLVTITSSRKTLGENWYDIFVH